MPPSSALLFFLLQPYLLTPLIPKKPYLSLRSHALPPLGIRLDWKYLSWRAMLAISTKIPFPVMSLTQEHEDRVGNSLLKIWELRFDHKAKLLFRLWAQGLVKILKVKFRQDLYGEKIFYVGKKLVKLPTLATLVTHSATNFPTIWDQMLMFGWDFDVLIKICVWICDIIH